MANAASSMLPDDEKRFAFLGDANQSLRNFKRAGIAYAFAHVEKYMLAKAAGRSPQKPKPIRVPRAKR